MAQDLELDLTKILNYSEASRILGITRATIYAMIRRGELHPVAIADRRYLNKEEVDKVNEHREPLEGLSKK
jgi:excisionase family DNA binding protein